MSKLEILKERYNLKEEDIVYNDCVPIAIWITGYKGTNYDMTCKDFQYEIGKEYSMDIENIKICSKGFHFCSSLKEVIGYYPNGRYFKVRACVPLKQFNIGFCHNNKFAAYKIKIIKEISFEEISKENKYIKFLGSKLYNENITKKRSIPITYYLYKEISNLLKKCNFFNKTKTIIIASQLTYLKEFAINLDFEQLIDVINFIIKYYYEEESLKPHLIIYKLIDITKDSNNFIKWVYIYKDYKIIQSEIEREILE